MSRAEIYNMYKSWCDDTGHKPLSREKFLPRFRECIGDALKDETQVRRNGQRIRVYVFQDL
ncbi:MAG: hypothetical protein IJ449_00025 [Clostridia bacterium]|nr:hypothetical protein [Clostridia bacterium]